MSAPRLDPRLLEELARVDHDHRSIADIHRLLGAAAASLDLPRPSYEQTRVHVHRSRSGRSTPDEHSVTLDLDRYVGLKPRPRPDTS